jgi:hypothetical protein
VVVEVILHHQLQFARLALLDPLLKPELVTVLYHLALLPALRVVVEVILRRLLLLVRLV